MRCACVIIYLILFQLALETTGAVPQATNATKTKVITQYSSFTKCLEPKQSCPGFPFLKEKIANFNQCLFNLLFAIS